MKGLAAFFAGPFWKLIFAYLVILTVHAFLGRWTPGYLVGRDLWHFTISRMVIPMIMLGAVAAFVRLVPASLLLAAGFLAIGTISAIKREATGEPFQVSDLFLAGQGLHLLGYVGPGKWLVAGMILPAAAYSLRAIRFRRWSLPLFAVCAMLLSTYRIEAVAQVIHDYGPVWGVENLTFSQAESERMNGLGTHLYFSTAGLRLKTYSPDQVAAAMTGLVTAGTAPVRGGPLPDVYVVVGESWWRDPSDKLSPLDQLVAAGFAEGQAVSPVYGGTTPNAEFEVLTGIPVKSFRAGIIPYQHYLQYLTPGALALPRLLSQVGYTARAMHNFTRRFWLRDQVYPRFGFASFDSMDDMQITMQPSGWPTDDGLYAQALKRLDDGGPQFTFLVTVMTHGPYAEDVARDGKTHPGTADYRDRLSGAARALAAFDRSLKARGRPYVLLIVGDHLPGLRLHQWKIGMVEESDPRLHQVPFLISGNTGEAPALRDRLMGRPLYCFSPLVAEQLRLGITDRYFRYVARQCSDSAAPTVAPAEAVIQNQLFSTAPLL
ncbi:MAG: sulfatase-like hydrolase/transferase [Rhizobiales bacterium]|nr:sulfatase-like hydrolase/transferase [Hyphomicrobiales bacterium]MBI3674004.1 sulfatase-like hydrolase/transferase [Hyphomicrobiales bacterium]